MTALQKHNKGKDYWLILVVLLFVGFVEKTLAFNTFARYLSK